MSDTYDLIVVGGGIGGSALAATMAEAGKAVLVLEKSTVFEDHVRGEWIAPWGVAEVKRLGLYDLLVSAGGHHLARHVTYDETRAPEEAEATALPLDIFIEGVPGPLCIGHPKHCQTLFDAAGRAGATTLRGVDVNRVTPGATPEVEYRHDGETHVATARLIAGADGRASVTRAAADIQLNQDKPHHMFGGLLVDGAEGWKADMQAIGTEGDFAFLVFPQGGGRVRIYGSYSLNERRRFAGEKGPRAFLDAFRMTCAPDNRYLADATPAGPLLSYFNNDAWTVEPFAEGVVLVGDAAGWNDPINGLGLSITYRDVRIVRDLLKSSEDWTSALLAPYAQERAERMRRLRFTAKIQSTLDAEFGEAARERRRRYFERSAANPELGAHAFAIMAGPETLPPEMFTEERRMTVLGEPKLGEVS
ncbi:MAG: monooxygenase [Alphaproteobacteria bacterium HGW-Alphaproteobacteria-12]|nr:MAG: monooxygenase [Alphaproteobacteria bacterium HGW-Alphaproteobacteria-12]